METKWAILLTEYVHPRNLLVKIFPGGIDIVCPGDWIVVGWKALIREQEGVKPTAQLTREAAFMPGGL